MSYFLDTYEFPFVFIAGLIVLAVLLAAFCYLAYRITKRLKSGPKWVSLSQGLAVLGAAISFFLLLSHGPDYLNDGRIASIYLVEKHNHKRLVVWFTREDTPAGMTEAYSHRIKSFDLDTGEQRGRLTLSRRYWFNDYQIFGPFHHFAWGYSHQNGMVCLDLFAAEVVAHEKTILKRNPELGGEVHLMTGKGARRFDPVTFGLYVYTANGDIYRINPDLKATNVRSIDKSKERHVAATCAVCRHDAQFIDIDKAKTGWLKNAQGNAILRFADKGGRTLNAVNLHKMFDDSSYLYATAHVRDEIWLFVTMKRYTLSALRTDAQTGKLIGRIDFF